MQICVAGGRRVDATDSDIVRFPLNSVPAVRLRVREALARIRPDLMIASAAAGADLLALEAAADRGAPIMVILPSAPSEFRADSVDDRPGEWASVFDRIITIASQSGSVVILRPDELGSDPFEATNRKLISTALELAGGPQSVSALVIWDGLRRGDEDYSADLIQRAADAGLQMIQIPTSSAAPER